jgi:hypothetical protein
LLEKPLEGKETETRRGRGQPFATRLRECSAMSPEGLLGEVKGHLFTIGVDRDEFFLLQERPREYHDGVSPDAAIKDGVAPVEVWFRRSVRCAAIVPL